MVGWIILAIWLLGLPFAYRIVWKWKDNDFMTKLSAVLIWPLTLMLYLIHLFHNKEW